MSAWRGRGGGPDTPAGDPFALIGGVLSRVIALDPEHQRVLRPLTGRRLRLCVTAPVPLVVDLHVDGGRLHLEPPGSVPPDLELRGSATSLLALVRSAGQALPGGLGVAVSGDLAVLESLRDVIRGLRPDWEEPVARLFGDRAAAPLTRLATSVVAAVANGAREMRDLGVEYLKEESGALPSAEDLTIYSGRVRALGDDTERLLKRFDALEAALVAAQGKT